MIEKEQILISSGLTESKDNDEHLKGVLLQ